MKVPGVCFKFLRCNFLAFQSVIRFTNPDRRVPAIIDQMRFQY